MAGGWIELWQSSSGETSKGDLQWQVAYRKTVCDSFAIPLSMLSKVSWVLKRSECCHAYESVVPRQCNKRSGFQWIKAFGSGIDIGQWWRSISFTIPLLLLQILSKTESQVWYHERKESVTEADWSTTTKVETRSNPNVVFKVQTQQVESKFGPNLTMPWSPL